MWAGDGGSIAVGVIYEVLYCTRTRTKHTVQYDILCCREYGLLYCTVVSFQKLVGRSHPYPASGAEVATDASPTPTPMFRYWFKNNLSVELVPPVPTEQVHEE